MIQTSLESKIILLPEKNILLTAIGIPFAAKGFAKRKILLLRIDPFLSDSSKKKTFFDKILVLFQNQGKSLKKIDSKTRFLFF